MADEKKQLKDVLIKVGICVLCASLYAMGGSADFGGLKWLRRFLMPSIFSGALLYYTKDFKSLISLPLAIGSMILGYGGTDYVFLKIVKRGYCGVAYGASYGVHLVLNKRFLLFIFNLVLVTVASIAFGVFNPFTDNAILEQFVIGFLIVFIPLMSAREK